MHVLLSLFNEMFLLPNDFVELIMLLKLPAVVVIMYVCTYIYVCLIIVRTQEIKEKEAEQTAALQQDVRDMEFFLRTSAEMSRAAPEVQSDVRDGTVLIGEGGNSSNRNSNSNNSNSNSNKKSKRGGSCSGNKKTKKKR
jgi:hypothetical protein